MFTIPENSSNEAACINSIGPRSRTEVMHVGKEGRIKFRDNWGMVGFSSSALVTTLGMKKRAKKRLGEWKKRRITDLLRNRPFQPMLGGVCTQTLLIVT